MGELAEAAFSIIRRKSRSGLTAAFGNLRNVQPDAAQLDDLTRRRYEGYASRAPELARKSREQLTRKIHGGRPM
jgi:hypothetical protein